MIHCVMAFMFVVVGAGGCSLMPRYERPQAPVASHWPEAAGDVTKLSGRGAMSAELLAWREFFKDPRLQQLIELALRNNRDLRIAALNVEQFRGQYRVIRNALLPSFEANAGMVKQRQSIADGHETLTTYSVSLDTGYELDFFGRLRSLKAGVVEQYLATEAARTSLQTALISDVAVQYLLERSLDEQLGQVTETLKSVQDYYDLVSQSYSLGNSTELDLRSAEAQVEAAKARLADYRRQRAQAEAGLVFLIGSPLPADLPPPQNLDAQGLLEDLPAGLPSDLINRRPDITQAEHQIRSANANIGAVKAAFFPRITLTTSGGTSSSELAELFARGSEAWAFVPNLTVPIFNRNNNLGNLQAAQALQNIEVARYEKTVQAAFREVSDALIARRMYQDQIEAQKALVRAQQKRYDAAGLRYKNGIDNYLTVLLAQQDFYAAQQNLIQFRFQRLANLVLLYKALGGGWKP